MSQADVLEAWLADTGQYNLMRDRYILLLGWAHDKCGWPEPIIIKDVP